MFDVYQSYKIFERRIGSGLIGRREKLSLAFEEILFDNVELEFFLNPISRIVIPRRLAHFNNSNMIVPN